jgi:hypothetical protein
MLCKLTSTMYLGAMYYVLQLYVNILLVCTVNYEAFLESKFASDASGILAPA